MNTIKGNYIWMVNQTQFYFTVTPKVILIPSTSFVMLIHCIAGRSNRWTMRNSYGMPNQVAPGGKEFFWRISKGPGTQNETTAIYTLKMLASYFVTPQLKGRLEDKCLRRDIRMNIQEILNNINEKNEKSDNIQIKHRDIRHVQKKAKLAVPCSQFFKTFFMGDFGFRHRSPGAFSTMKVTFLTLSCK